MQGLCDSHRAQSRGAEPVPPHEILNQTISQRLFHMHDMQKNRPKVYPCLGLLSNRDSQGEAKRTQVKEFADRAHIKGAATERAPWYTQLDPIYHRNL